MKMTVVIRSVDNMPIIDAYERTDSGISTVGMNLDNSIRISHVIWGMGFDLHN